MKKKIQRNAAMRMEKIRENQRMSTTYPTGNKTTFSVTKEETPLGSDAEMLNEIFDNQDNTSTSSSREKREQALNLSKSNVETNDYIPEDV